MDVTKGRVLEQSSISPNDSGLNKNFYQQNPLLRFSTTVEIREKVEPAPLDSFRSCFYFRFCEENLGKAWPFKKAGLTAFSCVGDRLDPVLPFVPNRNLASEKNIVTIILNNHQQNLRSSKTSQFLLNFAVLSRGFLSRALSVFSLRSLPSA